MALQFHPLPLEIFEEEQRPFIGRLNVELRQVFGLESVINQPLISRRSDNTIVRRAETQVDVTRITPSIMETVSGSSTIIGVPALVFGTVNAVGSTRTVVSINSSVALFGTGLPAGIAATAAAGTSAFAARADHVHLFPTSLRSTTSGATWTLTDTGTDMQIEHSIGTLTLLAPLSGFFYFDVPPLSTAAQAMRIQMRPGAGNNIGLQVQASNAGAALSSVILKGFDFNMTQAAAMTGVTLSGADISVNATPSSGSGANGLRALAFSGGLINNATGSWSEVTQLYLSGPRRLFANPTVTVAATEILECPTISGTTQIGLLISQRTAQQVAAKRYAVYVQAQNSGTERYCFYGVSDTAQFGGKVAVDGAIGVTGLATFGNSLTVLSGNVITGGLQCDSVINDTGLAHGTSSPAVSVEVNMGSSVSAAEAQYMRVGNVVNVSGRFTADPLLTATATSFELSLPVASNIGAPEDLAGTAFCGAIAGQGASIRGSTANDTAVVEWVSGDITSQTWSYSYTYQVI